MGVLPAFAYFATVCYIYTGKYKICHEGTPEIIGTPQRLPTNTAGTGAPANTAVTPDKYCRDRRASELRCDFAYRFYSRRNT